MHDEFYDIDAIEGVRFTRSQAPTPNFQNLLYGIVGMESIYRQVKHNETLRSKGAAVCYTPNDISEAGMLSSLIYWFGVTLVNHTRLSGMLCFLVKNGLRDQDLLIPSTRSIAVDYTNKYVVRVIPDVLTWRNKVGAHYALTDPRKQDTLQDIQQSVMTNVAWVRMRWRTCGMRWHGSEIPEWSLTEEVERLTSRYWPHFSYASAASMIPGRPSNFMWSPGPHQNGVPTGFVYSIMPDAK